MVSFCFRRLTDSAGESESSDVTTVLRFEQGVIKMLKSFKQSDSRARYATEHASLPLRITHMENAAVSKSIITVTRGAASGPFRAPASGSNNAVFESATSVTKPCCIEQTLNTNGASITQSAQGKDRLLSLKSANYGAPTPSLSPSVRLLGDARQSASPL